MSLRHYAKLTGIKALLVGDTDNSKSGYRGLEMSDFINQYQFVKSVEVNIIPLYGRVLGSDLYQKGYKSIEPTGPMVGMERVGIASPGSTRRRRRGI